MVTGFLAFHQIAAQRGDGLRPELVKAPSRPNLVPTLHQAITIEQLKVLNSKGTLSDPRPREAIRE